MKQRIQNATLLLVSILLSLLLMEQGFRCWLFGWKAFDINALRNNSPISNSGLMIQSPYDDIYWALQPNLDTTFKMAHLFTNSHGQADQEYSKEKPENLYRIAVLGDSYSMATGVDTDKSFHALLEDWMNRKNNGNYEIINFAVGGFGLERYNATLQHLVPEWQPDAILLGYCGFNDQQALPPPTGNIPAFNPRRFDGFWTSYVYAYLKMISDDRAIIQDRSSPVLTEKNLVFIDQQLGKMRHLADQIKPGMPIVLAFLDNREHSEKDLLAIEILAGKHNILFADTSREFKNKNLDDYSLHVLDSHPNEAAHSIFATALWQTIQQRQIYDFSETESP